MDWPIQSTESSAILLTRLLYTHVYGLGTWIPFASKFTSCKQPRHAIMMDCRTKAQACYWFNSTLEAINSKSMPLRAKTMHRSRITVAWHSDVEDERETNHNASNIF